MVNLNFNLTGSKRRFTAKDWQKKELTVPTYAEIKNAVGELVLWKVCDNPSCDCDKGKMQEFLDTGDENYSCFKENSKCETCNGSGMVKR